MKKKKMGVMQEKNSDNLATRLSNDFNHYFVSNKFVESIYFFDSTDPNCTTYREHIKDRGLDILLFLSEERIEEARKIKLEFPQLKVIVLCKEIPSDEVIFVKSKELTCKSYLELLGMEEKC